MAFLYFKRYTEAMSSGRYVRSPRGKYNTVSPEYRFNKNLDKDGPLPQERPELGPCWIWKGYKNKLGYGTFNVGSGPGRTVMAYKFSYQSVFGTVPHGLELDHLCRCRACCNPNHLEAVTHMENIRRGDTGKAVAAYQRAKTHCPKGHPYDDANTYFWGGEKRYRACRACWRLRGKSGLPSSGKNPVDLAALGKLTDYLVNLPDNTTSIKWG